MKNSVALLLAGLALTASPLLQSEARAAAGLPYYDSFNYSEGILNVVGSPTWVAGNGSSTFEIAVSNAAALTAPPGFPVAANKGVRRAPSTTARRSVFQFTSVPAADGTTVYVSFLLNVQSPPGTAQGQLLGYLDNNSTSQGSPQCGIFLDANSKLGIAKKASAPDFTMATNLGPGTHLVVARYTFLTGPSDRVDLWVDPSPADYGAGTAPTPLGGDTGTTEPPSLDYFQIATVGNQAGVQYMDEFRVGTTWADVVPSGVPLVGEKLGFTTQPANAPVNTLLNPVVVQVQTSGGIPVASNNVPVTLTLTGGGSLGGTTTQNTDSSGKATFNNLTIDTVGTGKQLTATASGIGTGLTADVSTTFSITAPPVASKLGFTTQPANALAGSTMNPVVVQAQDSTGAAVASNNVPITLTLNSGSLTGTTTQNTDSSGKATFNNLSINAAGTGKQLTAAASGIGLGLTSATSSSFSITNVPLPAGTPVITQIVATASSVILRGTNGPANRPYHVLSTADITTARDSWPAIATNAFNAQGNFAATNPVVGTRFYLLRVPPPPPTAPTIVTHPQSQTNFEGATAFFTVVANGTAPLHHQWHFENGTALPDRTNATLALGNLTTNDARGYFVIVTNSIGSATSLVATLTVNPAPTNQPDFSLTGFATGVTGGEGFGVTNIVIATNLTSFGSAVSNTEPYIVYVQGTIFLRTNGNIYIRPNKSIIGLGTNATLVGDLAVFGPLGNPPINSSNVIIRNVTITNPQGFGEDDGVTVKYGGHHVWVDHCTFVDCGDGNLDVTREGDYVTVSWCKFSYTVPNGHEDVNLIGGDDGDASDLGKLHVTFHHNAWGNLCRERMPSVRYGRVHVYNNYYNAPGNHYCVRTRLFAEVLGENNYFQNVQNPFERLITSGTPGKMAYSGNITVSCTTNTTYDPGIDATIEIPTGTDTLDASLNPPPYSYTLDAASVIPFLLETYGGAGKGPFAP